jgi:alkyl sulfatase BDS1-like metallo-beta-lactamase superfamily hydrolase
MERFFDSMAARLDGPKAQGRETTINFVFSDLDESHVLTVENTVLHHKRRDPDPGADATIRRTRDLVGQTRSSRARRGHEVPVPVEGRPARSA